jgi:hypothetical protein
MQCTASDPPTAASKSCTGYVLGIFAAMGSAAASFIYSCGPLTFGFMTNTPC